MYFYHPDHLGSSSYITDREGRITQHTEYIAFGEVLFEEHSTSKTMPYLFNGKELDTETGLYYYGARYYDPKTSIFLNVDPLAEKTMTPYAYTNNNPIMLVDPDGRESTDWYQNRKTGDIEWKDTNKQLKGYNHLGRQNTVGITGKKQESRMYYLNANGSATEKTGDGKTTLAHAEGGKSIQTIGGTTITSKKSFWNSDLRRRITGDKAGFSVGVDATAFLGVSISFDFDWILTGSDASVFPYFGVSTGANIANGFNGSVDFSINKALFTGPASEVKASDLPGTSYGASMGIKAIAGGEIGYSYSSAPTGKWHQVQGGIGVGLEFSPATAATIKGSVSQQWFNIHTKTGKVNY